ncbi:hypothetical protein FA15DRAFT_673852 [Coprinopsis marcescibilis]|uniref:Secreted protein n=1 Tax=Coprinopsis marcescibilis TaxID=230819 RepID=A0A5C3KIQ5_COPMA|nr:hypothetical protein FA15DRAFT_673852 [Coprinopsis marcescibilis]
MLAAKPWILNCILLLLCWTFTVSAAPPPGCTYSCPVKDANNYPLVRTQGALSPTSWYSMFECIYAPEYWRVSGHVCYFNKESGLQHKGFVGNQCPPRAASTCGGSIPQFSSHDENGKELKPEVETWTTRSKNALWQKSHPKPK